MFFKNIDEWTNGKLRRVTCLWATIYFLFATLIPCIIIGTKYQLFKNTSIKVTAAFIIIAVIIATFGLKAIKWLVNALPEAKKGQQILKYTIEMVLALIVPSLIILGILLIKKNMDLALSTLTWCVASFMCAIVIEHLTLKSLMYQWRIISKVDEDEKKERIKKARLRRGE